MKSSQQLYHSILTKFCVIIFMFSSILFVYLFFYQSFKVSYEDFKKQSSIETPVYEAPRIQIPQILQTPQTSQTPQAPQTEKHTTESSFDIEKLVEQKFAELTKSTPHSTTSTTVTTSPELTTEIAPDIKDAQKIFVAYELGDSLLASRLIVDFIADHPNSSYKHKVRLIGANLMNERGDYEGALNYIQKILGETHLSNEDYSESVMLLGSIARERRQYDSYIQSFLEQAYFRAEEPTKSKLAFYLGYLLLHKGDHYASLTYFNNVIGEDGVLGKADLYAAQSMRPERINELENFIKAYPSSKNYDYVTNSFVKDVLIQGEDLTVRGYLDSAERVYRKTVKYFPDSADGDEARLKIAEVYYQKQKLSEAISILQEALKNDNTLKDPDVLFALGKISFEMDRYDESLGYFRILTEKYPNYKNISKVREWQTLLFESLKN